MTGDVARLPYLAQRQCEEIHRRLAERRIEGRSARGIATVIYNGHGVAQCLTLAPGAKEDYGPASLAEFVTDAFRAADHGLDCARRDAFDAVRIGADSAAGWRRNPNDARSAVAAAFD